MIRTDANTTTPTIKPSSIPKKTRRTHRGYTALLVLPWWITMVGPYSRISSAIPGLSRSAVRASARSMSLSPRSLSLVELRSHAPGWKELRASSRQMALLRSALRDPVPSQGAVRRRQNWPMSRHREPRWWSTGPHQPMSGPTRTHVDGWLRRAAVETGGMLFCSDDRADVRKERGRRQASRHLGASPRIPSPQNGSGLRELDRGRRPMPHRRGAGGEPDDVLVLGGLDE